MISLQRLEEMFEDENESYVIHTEGGKYIIWGPAKMKVGQIWHQAVVYFNPDSDEMFVRAVEDFCERFTEQ